MHCLQELVGLFQELKPAPQDLEIFGLNKHRLVLVVAECLSPRMEHLIIVRYIKKASWIME
jgi:hypothetical protein